MLTLLHDMLDDRHLGNSVEQWLWALATALGVLLVSWFVRRVIRRNYTRMAATAQVEIMEVPLRIFSHTTVLFLLALSTYAGALLLELSPRATHVIDKVVLIASFWQVGIWATTGAIAWIHLKQRIKMDQDRATAGTLGIIAIIVRLFIWSVVLLLTLENLGVNVTALVAGLGVGGIAIALAVQNILGDLLASLSITLDKPFVLGDFLIVGEFKGRVEHIGVKTTRLRSVDGEQIIMPNADLLKSRMRNFERMEERRVQLVIGVTYETPYAKLQRLPSLVAQIVTAQPKVRLERCHLARLGSYAVELEVVFFVRSKEYTDCMDVQQAINLQLLETFAREQIEFAYPTQKQWSVNLPLGIQTDLPPA